MAVVAKTLLQVDALESPEIDKLFAEIMEGGRSLDFYFCSLQLVNPHFYIEGNECNMPMLKRERNGRFSYFSRTGCVRNDEFQVANYGRPSLRANAMN